VKKTKNKKAIARKIAARGAGFTAGGPKTERVTRMEIAGPCRYQKELCRFDRPNAQESKLALDDVERELKSSARNSNLSNHLHGIGPARGRDGTTY